MQSMVDREMAARCDPGRLAVGVVAAIFFLAGVLGLTSGSGDGMGTDAALPASDAVHLVLGMTGLAVARARHGARTYLIAGGVVYFLWHYGGPVLRGAAATPFPPANVNEWLNLWLAVSMIALACLAGDRTVRASTRDSAADEVVSRLSVSWRPVHVSGAAPSARPRRPRAAAGSRPPAPGRHAYGI
jgi:uncharacterized protein DUF4383